MRAARVTWGRRWCAGELELLPPNDWPAMFGGPAWSRGPLPAPGELHSVFNFDFLCCGWEAPALREVIDATLDSHAPVGATPTWVAQQP